MNGPKQKLTSVCLHRTCDRTKRDIWTTHGQGEVKSVEKAKIKVCLEMKMIPQK